MIPTSPLYAKRIAQRANDAVRRIGEKPTSIVLRTAGLVSLPAQTVRIEPSSNVGEMTSTSGASPIREVIIFGVRGHSSVPDTVIDEGYTFNLEGDRYTVRDVIVTLGEVQAVARVTG